MTAQRRKCKEEMSREEAETKQLSFPLLVKTVFRGFFIQSAWNYENFQGIGFAYTLIPFLRRIPSGQEAMQDILKRHVTCFNTNPYLSGMIVGGVMRMEEEHAAGRVTADQIESYKKGLTGALGALGDSLIWGALRPLAGLVAVLVALLAESLAPLIFLLLYNAGALWFRVTGVRNGYAYGVDLLAYLKKIDLQQKIYWMNCFILFAVGVLLPLWIFQAVPVMNFTYLGLFGFMAILIGSFWIAERRGISLLFQVAALLLLSELLAHVGWLPL